LKIVLAESVIFNFFVGEDRRHGDKLVWGSELDERMRHIMPVQRMSLAVTAEVGVRTDGALVAVANDRLLSWLSSTKRSIAENHGVSVEVAGRPTD
jgi:hypothetical protein